MRRTSRSTTSWCTRPRPRSTRSRPTSQQAGAAAGLGPPQISADGKTVTVHIKSGFKFSAPVNRDSHLGRRRLRVPARVQPERPERLRRRLLPDRRLRQVRRQADPGISTPNKTTIVFHLTKNFGATMAEALTLPGTAPVPESYAAKFDKSSPSKYDSDPTMQAFTRPVHDQELQRGPQHHARAQPRLEPPASTACARPTPTRSCGTPAPTRPSPLTRRSTAPTC